MKTKVPNEEIVVIHLKRYCFELNLFFFIKIGVFWYLHRRMKSPIDVISYTIRSLILNNK